MEDQIAKTRSGDSETENRHPKADTQSVQVYRPRRWLAVAATSGLALTGVAGFGWLYWTSLAFPDVIDGLKFLTEGSIALAILIVAIVQASVYWSQRGVMKQQWSAMKRSLERT